MDRAQLTAQIGKLPPQHFLRQFVDDAGWRLVGVENREEPFRTQSTTRLHQAVLDTVHANDDKRFTITAKPSSPRQGVPVRIDAPAAAAGDAPKCTQSVSRTEDGKRILTIVCELGD